MRSYLPLFRKDSITHMHGSAASVKEGLLFAWDLSLENSTDSCLCFRPTLLRLASYFFFIFRSPSSSSCTVFDSVSSNIDEVLSINQSANAFVFEDFNIHHKDWLTRIFLTRIPYCGSHSPALLDFLLSSDASISSTMAFLHWEILITLLPQFP